VSSADYKRAEINRHLTRERLRELFNLQGAVYATRGGSFDGEIYEPFHRFRETGPVHEGTPGPMVGYDGPAFFTGIPEPDRRHFSAFDWETCDFVARTPDVYIASPHEPGSEAAEKESSILYLDGERHHRYRALVQPSFIPKKAQWWLNNWVQSTVDALVDEVVDRGEADLNVDVFAPVPLLTICGSFGVTIPQALDIREAVTSDGLGIGKFLEIVAPLIPMRRAEPQDDLISVLARAEMTDDDHGVRHVLSDEEILGLTFLILAAGSGTTWKQMGITMLALLWHPEWLDRLREDRTLMRAVIEESLRWHPTDPVFSRYVAKDTNLGGVDVPAGAVMHMVFAAANRDPTRWERPDEFDPGRPLQTHMGFGSGHHVCLGMHVARAEIACALTAVLDRMPNVRLDPSADPPKITGVYERGPTAVPVVWDR
jgi:cytochrome P450